VITKYIFGDALTTGWLALELFLAGFVVVAAGVRLTKLADRLAEEWRLGSAFVGMLLLATVTSLPEVVAGTTAGAIGSADLAFGAIYGSCSFNIVIIVIMNMFASKPGSILRSADRAHLLTASSGIILISLRFSRSSKWHPGWRLWPSTSPA
jgi:cation:H+ antiporter